MNHPQKRDEADAGVEARRQYLALRSVVAAPARLAALHIGGERTALAVGADDEPATVVALALGSVKTAAAHLRHDPPSPIEMENAIMVVEDELVRVRERVAGCALVTMDPAIAEIARLAGVAAHPEMTLSLEAVEQTFDRFSGVVLGRPAASEGLPTGGAFAATLLILRELMHHLKFAAITIRT